MNTAIPDQNTFRKYRSPADIKYGTDKKTPVRCQYKYYFPNGYGASVIKLASSCIPEAWELAVIKQNNVTGARHLCYDTPITDDVISGLTGEGICKLLEKIIRLPGEEINCV